MKRAYGFRPSPPDHRDKVTDTSGLTVLDSVDLRDGPMPLVFDQLSLGSCTANAVAACLQYDCSLDSIAAAHGPCVRRSRLSIYYGERQLEGTLGEDDPGAYGRDGFKYAQQTGVLLETAWPYDIATYQGPQPAGARRKLTKPYAAVQKDKAHIQAVLSNQQMIAFGFKVYSRFESDLTAQTGIVDLPILSMETFLGGHEVCMAGYGGNVPAGYVLCRNSWGSGWALGGYFYMAWDYVLSNLTSDLRCIVRAA